MVHTSPMHEWDAEAPGTTDCAQSANLRLHLVRPPGTARRDATTPEGACVRVPGCASRRESHTHEFRTTTAGLPARREEAIGRG